MGRMRAAIRIGTAAACAGTLLCGALWLPQATRGGWGQQLALLSASLLQPQQGAQWWLQEWEPQFSAGPNVTVTPPVREETTEQDPPAGVQTVIPPKGDGGGTVSEEQIGGGTALTDTVYIKNTSGVDADFAALLAGGTSVAFTKTDQPQVLIVHTHTTESYMSYYAGYYNDGDCIRTSDAARNVCVAGDALAARLRTYGIVAVHDKTVHDYPQYTGAYTRSAETVSRLLAQYPSVRLVIDLHRDALLRDDVTKIKPTVTVDGKKAAQMMIIAAAGNSDDAPNPYWETNVALGLQLQEYLSRTYAGLMRPISFTESRYNQQLFPGFLLVEVGGEANTFSEASYAAALLGDAIAQVLSAE